jgi:excisionase family DNA binding protein
MERMSTSTQVRPLLKVGEVAERLNLSESTVRRRIEMAEIPALRLGAGPQSPVRVDPAALEAWLEAVREATRAS